MPGPENPSEINQFCSSRDSTFVEFSVDGNNSNDENKFIDST
jgi:hypothetical protein